MVYGLKPGVHLADVDGDLVLLDARRNAYFCVPRASAVALKPILSGNHRSRPDAEMLDELEAAGLFGLIDGRGAPAAPARRAVTDLGQFAGARARATPMRCWRLSVAVASAQFALRARAPEHWLGAVARRNAALTKADTPLVHALARFAVDSQPIFPRTARCLPSSMSMINFLHSYGYAVRWVFGVRTYPFEAHCWVEAGGVVLNDSVEHIRSFTPIVAV